MKHETLGELKFDGDDQWTGKVTLAAAFGKRKWPRRLALELPGHEDGPDPKAVKLMAAVVKRSPELADLIVDGLWAELDGREKQNQHWWALKKGLAEVNKHLVKPITGRDDLWRVLKPDTMFVREDFHGDGALTAGISFRCDFEVEHGLDVLTDGIRVLGTGYSRDAEKYRRFRALKKRSRRSGS